MEQRGCRGSSSPEEQKKKTLLEVVGVAFAKVIFHFSKKKLINFMKNRIFAT